MLAMLLYDKRAMLMLPIDAAVYHFRYDLP